MFKRLRSTLLRTLFWLTSKLERLRERYPLRKAKLHSALLILLLLLAPILLMTFLIELPFMIWDVFDPFGIDVHPVVYLVFGLLYLAEIIFFAIQIKELHAALEIMYRPVRALTSIGAERTIAPMRSFLMKAILITGLFFGLIIIIIIVHGSSGGFSLLHFLLISVIVLIYLLLVVLSTGFYVLVKTAAVFILSRIVRGIDRKLGIGEYLKNGYAKYKRERIQKKR